MSGFPKLLTILTVTNRLDGDLVSTIKSVNAQGCPQAAHIICIPSKLSSEWDSFVRLNGLEIPLHTRLEDCIDYGLYASLNYAMGLIDTSYFMFLHSGDTFVSNTCAEHLIKIIKQNHNADILSFPVDRVVRWPFILRKGLLWRFFRGLEWFLPPHTGLVYNTDFHRKILGNYDPSFSIAGDSKMLYQAKINDRLDNLIFFPEVLVRMSSGGKSGHLLGDGARQQKEEEILIFGFTPFRHKLYFATKLILRLFELRISLKR